MAYKDTDLSHLTEKDYMFCIKKVNFCVKNLIEKNTSYSERKKQSILIAKAILIEKNIDTKYIDFFESHSKKDDLADSLLQAIWFIKEKNN